MNHGRMLNENGQLKFPKTATTKDISNPPEQYVFAPVHENDTTSSHPQASVSDSFAETQNSEVSISMSVHSLSEVDIEMEKSDSQMSQSTVVVVVSSLGGFIFKVDVAAAFTTIKLYIKLGQIIQMHL